MIKLVTLLIDGTDCISSTFNSYQDFKVKRKLHRSVAGNNTFEGTINNEGEDKRGRIMK
jgi:hypothetical protein